MAPRFWLRLLVLLVAFAGSPGATTAAQATPAGAITVTSTADTSGGPACTLRDAITAANTDTATGGCPAGSPGLDTITFSLPHSCLFHPCPIILGSPLPTITEDLTIAGGGSTIVSGGSITRLFNVASGFTLRLQHLLLVNANSGASDGGAIANDGNLWLEHSTIQNSRTDSNHSGGAIFSDGPVTITDSTLQYNKGGSGGALFANFGNAVVTISNTTFLQNQAVNTTTTGYGGAIWAGSLAQVTILGGAILSNTANEGGGLFLSSGAVLVLTSSGPPASVSGNSSNNGGGILNSGGTLIATNITLSGNSAMAYGGGIDNAGTLTLTNDTLSGNSAQVGGGVLNVAGTLIATNSTLSGNSATAYGGGIDNASTGTLTLTNDTLSGNSSNMGGGIRNGGYLTATNVTLSSNLAQTGGGISNGGTLTMTNVTLGSNSAPTGGGLYQYGATLTLVNTIVAYGPLGVNCYDSQGLGTHIASEGYNLSNDNSCTADFNQPTDLNIANPNLGPLADNGGPTLTQMPYPPSPAIDAVPLGANGCGTTLTTDQRGAPRPIHGKCDIGAVEYGWLYRYLWLPLVRR